MRWVTEQYLAVCAHNKHFMECREIVRRQIENQLAAYRQSQANQPGVLTTERVAQAARKPKWRERKPRRPPWASRSSSADHSASAMSASLRPRPSTRRR